MTNKEHGKKLIEESSRIFNRDLTLAHKENDSNLVMRRAQEVVELAIKGALKILGADYPKHHDVGWLLHEQAKEKKCHLDSTELEFIQKTSQELAQVRTISFYGEGEYTASEANQAFEQAKRVLTIIKKHFKIE